MSLVLIRDVNRSIEERGVLSNCNNQSTTYNWNVQMYDCFVDDLFTRYDKNLYQNQWSLKQSG